MSQYERVGGAEALVPTEGDILSGGRQLDRTQAGSGGAPWNLRSELAGIELPRGRRPDTPGPESMSPWHAAQAVLVAGLLTVAVIVPLAFVISILG